MVAALPAVGALLVTAIYVLPAAAARLVARSVPGLIAWGLALALAEGVLGLYLAYWLDLPPGPPVAVLGAVAYAGLALGARPMSAVAAEGLAVGYGGAPVLREVAFAVEPGQSVCVLGPNGGGKTTFFRALLGQLPRPRGACS